MGNERRDGRGRRPWAVVPLVVFLGLAANMSAVMAVPDSPPLHLRAEETGELRWEIRDPATHQPLRGAAGNFRIVKTRPLLPWFAVHYLGNGPVYEGPLATPEGMARLQVMLGDPGGYRLTYEAVGPSGQWVAGSREIRVAPVAAKVWRTMALLFGLALLGTVCGRALAGLWRPSTWPAFAGGLGVVLVMGPLAVSGFSTASSMARGGGGSHHVHPGGPGPSPAVREPVRVRAAVPGGLRGPVSLTVRREEDGLVFLRQSLPALAEGATWRVTFWDGTAYTLDLEGSGGRKRQSVTVQPLDPPMARQAWALGLLWVFYGAFLVVGMAWGWRRKGVDAVDAGGALRFSA